MSTQEPTPPSVPHPVTTIASHPWRTEPEIDAARQQFLAQRRAIKPNIRQGIYPFKDVSLTRADIEWLLVTHENGRGPLDGSGEQQRERLGLDLRGADLRSVNLRGLPLAGMCGGLTRDEWGAATLEQRDMAGVHLERADLSEAHLERAILRGAYLERATLRSTYLQGATLYNAYLQNTYLRKAHLEEANLKSASLQGAYLREAYLSGADLRDAFFDSGTNLEKIVLGTEQSNFVFLADVHWGDANLAVVRWTRIKMLGDEREARQQETRRATTQEKTKQLDLYRAAARANLQLANTLRARGMNEGAIYFAYRAQQLQRKVLWRQAIWGQLEPVQFQPSANIRQQLQHIWWRVQKFGAYIFSCFLDILAGYGYKPGRTLLIYLLMILGFATCYAIFGHLPTLQAIVFSVTSFHGRGFLPGPFTLGDPMTALAATEAVLGLFIEISFIATFTQRFFGK